MLVSPSCQLPLGSLAKGTDSAAKGARAIAASCSHIRRIQLVGGGMLLARRGTMVVMSITDGSSLRLDGMVP